MSTKLVVREDKQWEQIVFAEVLVPDVPNAFGDIYTRDAIRDFAYEFAKRGYGIDVNHDQTDVSGAVFVAETFLAREGDPDFIEGSWVVGMKIEDADIWAKVLSGEINGYSFEAIVSMVPTLVISSTGRQVSGVTSADPTDGHTHTYLIVVNELNSPISGGTSFDNGHAHTITTHTVTDVNSGHNHRIQVLLAEDASQDDGDTAVAPSVFD